MLPDDDKDFEDMAPSADPALDVSAETEAAKAAAAEASNADPSTATDATEDDGLLSVVRDVVDASRKPEEQAASSAEGEEGQVQDDGTPKAQDDEDFSDVPFHKHPRFQQLLRKSKAHEQDATRYRNVQNFMDQNGLAAEEAADLLVIGGLMKTNPVEAWKRMKPTIQKLLDAAGEVLSPELRQRVQKGEMSQDAALEVSRANAAQRSMSATRSFEQRRQEQRTRQDAVAEVQQAAVDWEATRRAKDPNFEAKMPLLMKEVAYLQRVEGVPDTPAGVQAQLAKAYKGIVLPSATPAPQAKPAPKKAITPIRGGQVAGGAKPEINGTMDVLKNVMARRSA